MKPEQERVLDIALRMIQEGANFQMITVEVPYRELLEEQYRVSTNGIPVTARKVIMDAIAHRGFFAKAH